MTTEVIFRKNTIVTILTPKGKFRCVDCHYKGEGLLVDRLEHFLTYSEGIEMIKAYIGNEIYVFPASKVKLGKVTKV